jgi:hypothetical protein
MVDEDIVDEEMEAMEMIEDEELAEPDGQSEIIVEADLEPGTGSKPSPKKEQDDE